MSVLPVSIFSKQEQDAVAIEGGISLNYKRDRAKHRPKLGTQMFGKTGLPTVSFSGEINEPGMIVIEWLGETGEIATSAELLDYHFIEGDKYSLTFTPKRRVNKNRIEVELELTVNSEKFSQVLLMKYK